MIMKNILEAIGNTPVIRLNHMTNEEDAEILVKFEGLNVGGSIKTRTAARMIEEAEAAGVINSDSLIVEATSGNQGIGLSLIAAVKGYKACIVMPDSVSEERRKLIQHYGAEVVLVHDEGNIGECIEECLRMVEAIKKERGNVFIPRQFENKANVAVHKENTARELIEQIEKPIHGFCSGIGTGGTITGIAEAIREVYPDVEVWAVEPENAAILADKEIKTHIQMGIGDGIIPPILNQDIIDRLCMISDEEAVQTARELALKEGILCGISSGTNVAAAKKMAKKLRKGKTVVTILPDTAERYFSTPLFKD